MTRARLIAALLMAGPVTTAHPASVAKTYSYFSIGGTTVEEILNELDARGPLVKDTGRRHYGAVETTFTTRVDYTTTAKKGCAITKASVTVKANIILPRWRRLGRADPEVRRIWEALSSDIKRGMESRTVIAKSHAISLEQALLRIGRQVDCDVAQTKVKNVERKVLAQYDRAQDKFGRIEGDKFERRFARLLRELAE